MKQLILHAGMPKTGTTSLQHFLSKNSEALKSLEITYHGYQGTDHSHDFLARLVYKNEWGQVSDFLGELAERVSPGGKAILSAGQFFAYTSMRAMRQRDTKFVEQFWEIEEQNCARLVEIAKSHFSEMDLVVFLRRQDKVMEASYNQSIKNGRWKGGDISEYQRYIEPRFSYDRILDRWSTLLGRQAIHPRIYERERLKDGDIRLEFCELLGIDSAVLTFSDPLYSSDNIRLPRDILEFKAIVNRIDMPKWKADLYARAIRKVAVDMGLDVKQWQDFLTQQERLQLLESVADCNKRLASEYFNADAVTPFTMSDLEVESDTDSYPGLDTNVALEIYLRLQSEMSAPSYRKQMIVRSFQDRVAKRFPLIAQLLSPRKIVQRRLKV